MPTSENLTASNNFLVNTDSDVSEITDQLSDSNRHTPDINAANLNLNDTNTSSINAANASVARNDKNVKSKQTFENEMPLSFASFYYSLKVIKGKGDFR